VADVGSSSSIGVPSLKFVGFAIRKLWRTMCVSINGPGEPDRCPFDLEAGICESKVGNRPSKFGHANPLGSRIIRYVRDRRTDRQTDGQKQRLLPLPTGGGIIIMMMMMMMMMTITSVMRLWAPRVSSRR